MKKDFISQKCATKICSKLKHKGINLNNLESINKRVIHEVAKGEYSIRKKQYNEVKEELTEIRAIIKLCLKNQSNLKKFFECKKLKQSFILDAHKNKIGDRIRNRFRINFFPIIQTNDERKYFVKQLRTFNQEIKYYESSHPSPSIQ